MTQPALTNQPRPDHAAYVSTWLKVLKEDSRAIFTAAAKAQEAADHLHGLQPATPAAAPQEPVTAPPAVLSDELPRRPFEQQMLFSCDR